MGVPRISDHYANVLMSRFIGFNAAYTIAGSKKTDMTDYIKNDVLVSHCDDPRIIPCIEHFSLMLTDHPSTLQPSRGIDEWILNISASYGFQIYSTVKKTTLFYDRATDCFLKILQPISVKHRIRFLVGYGTDRLYKLSQRLRSLGVNVPRVLAYGAIKRGRKPFFVMERVVGHSVYDLLIRKEQVLPHEIYFQIIEEVASLHRLGYWLGDAHIDHVFLENDRFSGFIDIDSIKKNWPFRLRNLAKDLARLNYPALPLRISERMVLLKYYMKLFGISKERHFLELVAHCSVSRWKHFR
jgi:hypothetical protein